MKRALLHIGLWVLLSILTGGLCAFVYAMISENEWLYP